MKQSFKTSNHLKDYTSAQLQQALQLSKISEKNQQNMFSVSNSNQENKQQEKALAKKKINQSKCSPKEDTITHCSCCPFYNQSKQRKLFDKITKQIIFMEDDFDTYQLHKLKQNEQNSKLSDTKNQNEGLYFSKSELEAINQGPLPKKTNQQAKLNNDNFQQQYNTSQSQSQQQQYNPFHQNRYQGEDDDMLQKRKNFYLNSGHSRTNSYDSYAQAISKQWLEQISEEREEQESQLTFQNKHLNNVYSSQNLKSENRYMISSNRNSICNNGNGNTTRRSSISGGDNEKSLSSLYSQQNQKGIQPSQQNTPQMSVVAPSVASSSTYMPQYSLNVIDPHLNNSEFESNNQLSPLDRKANNDLFNQQIHRKRNQHYRSQSCPYSFPYFKYSQNQTNEESNLQNGQNIRVMTIHEEEPYHNYVNSSSYQHSSNNSTRNKYRQQQPYRSNTNYRSASGGDYSISNFYQNTSQTPTTIVLEKKLQQNTNANLPFTSTPFCFENPSMGQNNHAATDQADEDQYLQESFYSQVYDGDQNHEFSVIKDKNTVNVSNKPSLENKIDREEIESNKECKNNKLKAQNQIQQLHLSSSAQNNQNTRYRGPSLVNDLGNNSNSCSMNIVKSLNQLDTDQGFISFRKEHSCSSQEGFVENFRSSHNSIDIDLKQKIKENIDKILKRQASKRQNRLILMLNNILNQFEKYDLDMNDFLHLLSKKSKLNIIQKASSFSQNGSSSGKNPSIPLIQSYQGSTNAHSFSIQNHAQTKGYQRSKNFWSYDFSNASKSMIPSDTISAYKKEFDDENNLRKAIMDGFQKISQQKNLYSSQILSQINDNPANSTQTSSQQINYQFMQPTAKFINDQHNLQLPQKISAETFKKVAIPLNTAPSSLQQFQNKDLRFNINKSDSKNKNNSNNKKNKEVDYSSNFQPATQSNVGSTFTFIGNHNESKNITNPQNANNQLQSSIPIIQHKSGFNQTQLNETNQQYSSNQNVLVQPQQQKNLEATQTSLQANQNNQYQNHNYSLNNLKNQTNGNNNPLNIKNQQTNPNNQLSNNLQGFGNTNNSINNSASHNLNNFLLNRISEECESPANTTYKQHQEYLNYESEQYLTGSKSKYHKKQQLMASGESNNTSSKPLDDGSSSQQIQILDNLLQSNENQKTNKIENCSTQNQLQQIPSEYKIYYNQNNIHNIQEQKEISQNQNTTTIFNLLNHTIANPNNLNQSNQQNPSANNSWLSSRSYEIFIPEENKLKSYADAQMLSFSKIKNAPSSHLSSQKSLNGVNNNQNYNQDFNDLQSNPQAANQNFAINQASISITSIKRVKSGENSPNDEDNIRFNQSQEIQENLNKKEQNLLKRNTNEQNFQTASQRFEYMNGFQIIQNLTKSLNQYQIKKDLQQAAQSQYQSASSSQTKSKEGVENIHSPYLSKFPSKISEEQSKMVSSGSYFNTSNNNLNINVTNQNKMMLSSNQFSNASQHLNTQNDNQNNVIQSITTENTLEQYNSTKQNVISNNKQNVHLTNSSRINQSNVNNMNNILNCSNSNHNTHNLNNNQVCSHRSSSNSNSNSNLHSHFNDNQTYQSVERSTEPYLQIEIQIERKQNNHNLLIQALKNKLQHTNPNIFAEIEEHIRMRPSYCFILVLQEDQYERAVKQLLNIK
ncbi:zinc-binding dehydrogenase family oxidoreductase (macronuclear) [Tetrahymena thermophila SB210]|uniref:Zinc-binding dehydrogenase family oxidoreductase n=1 Tax=Tetrahymena thermophila (strain SB210) TaxID=312017 RepID=I7MAA7_TETTS|nr:zinc-binding dehydrogenase family oxidoreductase [Tetrahymena thermophila SB210]EAS04226.3 zinc-binding dehydrogenase family oxidoreductase [Tetrahymena thermophila SB210]|eukprot:XP_001024471.3 zinc-binding dehydrogenase family oxidoreductase [Tetrahymena thermophila SB210]